MHFHIVRRCNISTAAILPAKANVHFCVTHVWYDA
jgi:hypothetical protein